MGPADRGTVGLPEEVADRLEVGAFDRREEEIADRPAVAEGEAGST
jgi:hypothetical protein